MRETAFTTADHAVLAPSGARFLVNKEDMDELLEKLQGGDETRGWEGDPRLALAFNRQTQRWELWRRERDEQYRLLARSRPGMGFPHTIVDELVSHDTRRGFDPKAYVDAHNSRLEAQKEHALSETMGPIYEKMAYALRKDDRTGAGL